MIFFAAWIVSCNFAYVIFAGGLAQLARALAWHARGHRFDSDILHHHQSNILSLESGKGYLYQSTDTQTKSFVYPIVVVSPVRRLTVATNSTPSVLSPVDPNVYPDNMTMVVLLTSNGTPVADAEVVAFVNGECRGAAVATTNGEMPLLLPAHCRRGQRITHELRAYIGGSIVTLSTDLTYTAMETSARHGNP